MGLQARALGKRRVRFEGEVFGDWSRRLALGTYVVPPRPGSKIGSGPYIASRYVPGLEIVYEPNPEWSGDPPLLDRVAVQFVSSTQLLLELVERGRLDAAVVPSAVNIDERLTEIGLAYEETEGWETIVLDMRKLADRTTRLRLAHSIDRGQLEEGLIRDDGDVVDVRSLARVPEGGGDLEVTLATASGDELLQLMQRVLQRQLGADGIKAELVQIDPATLYGEWESNAPTDVALRRVITARFNGPRAPRDLSRFPLFSVDTFVAFDKSLQGVEGNGTLDGPLWNVHEWWLE